MLLYLRGVVTFFFKENKGLALKNTTYKLYLSIFCFIFAPQ